DLEEVADDLGALPIEAPERQPDLPQPLQHLADLLREHQARQVHEHRCAEAGSHVGGAARQEAEFLVEGEGELPRQLLVEPVHEPPRLLDAEPGNEALYAEVIFLVDHDAGGIRTGQVYRSPARRILSGVAEQVARHEPTLQQDPAGAGLGAVELEQRAVPKRLATGGTSPELAQNGLPVIDPRTGTERVSLQVTRKTDAGREHDIRVVSAGLEPVQPVVRDRRELFHGPAFVVDHYARSRERIWSRSSASRSKSSDPIARWSR